MPPFCLVKECCCFDDVQEYSCFVMYMHKSAAVLSCFCFCSVQEYCTFVMCGCAAVLSCTRTRVLLFCHAATGVLLLCDVKCTAVLSCTRVLLLCRAAVLLCTCTGVLVFCHVQECCCGEVSRLTKS